MKRIFTIIYVICLIITTEATGQSSQSGYTHDKRIEIASPGVDGFPIVASGSIPITVNTHHPTSPTREVEYSCYANGKRLFTKRKLSRKTDWTWTDIAQLGHQLVGKTITIRVTATFGNGEKAEKEVRFLCSNRRPQPYLKDNWGNLLGNPQHNGVCQPTLIFPLKMAWINNIGANIHMTSPVVYKGKVFIASGDESPKGKSFIYALDGLTGKLLWQYSVHNSVKNTIVAEDGLVFALTVQGSLYAIKTEDGSLKWGKQLVGDGQPTLAEGLVISNGVIYAGAGSGLCAFNAQTGARIWQNRSRQQGENAASTLTLGKGMLIGAVQGKGLFGNDAQTGELSWHLYKNGLSNQGAPSTIHDNLLYSIADKSLFIIDPVTGKVIVRKEYPFSLNVASIPLLTDNKIIFGTIDNGLVAVDRETLEVQWNKPAGTIETSPVLSGSTVFFGASDGILYGVDKETGEVVWKHATGAPVLGSVAISGNTLIAVDFGGNVYAFTGQ